MLTCILCTDRHAYKHYQQTCYISTSTSYILRLTSHNLSNKILLLKSINTTNFHHSSLKATSYNRYLDDTGTPHPYIWTYLINLLSYTLFPFSKSHKQNSNHSYAIQFTVNKVRFYQTRLFVSLYRTNLWRRFMWRLGTTCKKVLQLLNGHLENGHLLKSQLLYFMQMSTRIMFTHTVRLSSS